MNSATFRFLYKRNAVDLGLLGIVCIEFEIREKWTLPGAVVAKMRNFASHRELCEPLF